MKKQQQQTIGFLLRDLSARYTARFEQLASGIPLTLMQCKVLVNLGRNEGLRQIRIAELTGIEPMAMVRLLNQMQEERLVVRRDDPQDRRARRLYLTGKGRAQLDAIWGLAARLRDEMFAHVNPQDRDTCLRVLEAAQRNLGGADIAIGCGLAPAPSQETVRANSMKVHS